VAKGYDEIAQKIQHDPVVAGDLLDLLGYFIVTLCHDYRGGHLVHVILQRDGHVGGVGAGRL